MKMTSGVRALKKRRGALGALAMLGGGVAGAGSLPSLSAQAAVCNASGWMSTSSRTAYSELYSIEDPDCQHKAAALCNGGWYAAGSWKNFGEVSSRQCPNRWNISNYGWYIQY